MTFRITRKRLQARFETLASLMGWDHKGPAYIFRADTPEGGTGSKAKVGYHFLEHNSVYGYSINRMVNEGGGESRIKESCSASEMDAWLGGAIFAADWMNRHGIAKVAA
jgi:hypothetical protein